MILGYNVLTGWDGPTRKFVPSSDMSDEKFSGNLAGHDKNVMGE
jgi:hypothetical protein